MSLVLWMTVFLNAAYTIYAMDSLSSLPNYFLISLLQQEPVNTADTLQEIERLKSAGLCIQGHPTLVTWAAKTKNYAITKAVLNITEGNIDDCITALQWAIDLCCDDILQLLLQEKNSWIMQNLFSRPYRFAIIKSCLIERPPAIRLMLQSGLSSAIIQWKWSGTDQEKPIKKQVQKSLYAALFDGVLAEQICSQLSKKIPSFWSAILKEEKVLLCHAKGRPLTDKEIDKALAFAFAQRKKHSFVQLLEVAPHCLTVDGEHTALASVIKALIRDTQRVRSTVENDEYLPVWKELCAEVKNKGVWHNLLWLKHILPPHFPNPLKIIILGNIIGFDLLSLLVSLKNVDLYV